METSRSKQDVITLLTASPHGNLAAYAEPVRLAVQDDTDFFAHLIAWNQRKGQVRDSKVALPLLGFIAQGHYKADFNADFGENALAHLALQSPRQLVQAYEYVYDTRPVGSMGQITKLVRRYLKVRELFPAWFIATALQHRGSLKRLYARTHTEPGIRANAVLKGKRDIAQRGTPREYPTNSVFHVVQHLADMPTAQEIGGAIDHFKIPYLVVRGALGARMKEPDVLRAVIDRMTPTEIVTNIKALQRLGATDHPALRAALGQGLKRASKSRRNVLKTTQAVQALAETGGADDALIAQLEDVQERQLVRSVEGNWLVLVDKSGSMDQAIALGLQVSSMLARSVVGQVHLMFFDITPRYFDATGKTLAELVAQTKGVVAYGGTSIGCGLMAAFDCKLAFDGIVIVSDGGENSTPQFAHVYNAAYSKQNVPPPVYWYQLVGDLDLLTSSLKLGHIDFQCFDLRGQTIDYYSLPNLVQTMNVKRYSLIDAVYDTPLLTIERALRCPKRFLEEVAIDSICL